MPVLVHITTVPQSLIFLTGQIPFMQAKGFEIHAISSPGKALDDFGVKYGVKTYAVDMPRRISPGEDLQSLLKIVAILKKIKPDIVHAHTPKGGLLGMIAATLANIKTRVYHMRGLPMMTATGFKHTLLSLTEKTSCTLAHQTICVSHSLRAFAIAQKLVESSKIAVLCGGSGNGVDARGRFNPKNIPKNTRTEIRNKYGIENDAKVIGFVGRLVRDKGTIELYEAWQTHRKKYKNTTLLIVGPFEPRDPVPEHIKEGFENDPRVILTGFTKDTPLLYSAMDFVVLPTYREGFPNVPMEAASMMLPVVATNIPGCVDAVQDGRTGTLVPVRDSQALADAMMTYLDDENLSNTHGQNGRQRMLEDFDPEKIWQALVEIYQNLLAARA